MAGTAQAGPHRHRAVSLAEVWTDALPADGSGSRHAIASEWETRMQGAVGGSRRTQARCDL